MSSNMFNEAKLKYVKLSTLTRYDSEIELLYYVNILDNI